MRGLKLIFYCTITLLESWRINHLFINGYSLEDIAKDREELLLEMNEISKYRGPILKDSWLPNHHNDDETVCIELYRKTLKEANVTWPPPKEPPEGMKLDYTIGGRADTIEWYMEEQQNGGEGYNWTIPLISSFRRKKNICGGYNNDNCDRMMKKYGKSIIEGKNVIVLGSQSPWAEASMFNAKANHVTTIEYMNIYSDYPNFTYYHPSEIARNYLDQKWEPVDVAFSYSSVEHDGLGRYGDPLNPFADLESVARMRCLLKPGGYLFLGIPLAVDTVVWNAHRLYGKYRLFFMLLGWKLINLYPENCFVESGKVERGHWKCQPLILLQKPMQSGSDGNSKEQLQNRGIQQHLQHRHQTKHKGHLRQVDI